MSWPETKGDKALACFLVLCVLVLVNRGCDNSARHRCEYVLAELQQSIYDNFGQGLWGKLYDSFSSARRSCRERQPGDDLPEG
jgi:hypothetical protein